MTNVAVAALDSEIGAFSPLAHALAVRQEREAFGKPLEAWSLVHQTLTLDKFFDLASAYFIQDAVWIATPITTSFLRLLL